MVVCPVQGRQVNGLDLGRIDDDLIHDPTKQNLIWPTYLNSSNIHLILGHLEK